MQYCIQGNRGDNNVFFLLGKQSSVVLEIVHCHVSRYPISEIGTVQYTAGLLLD